MKKSALKKVYLSFASAFIFLLHLPFSFGKTKPLPYAGGVKKITVNDSCSSNANPGGNDSVNLYDKLLLGSFGLSRYVFDYALNGFNKMIQTGKLKKTNIISIIDFSKPSTQKRLFVIDLEKSKVLFHTYVAHGVNSGKEFARIFSNEPESNKSSLGFYATAETYIGKNGYSMHLQGIEKGINDNAYKREIVMHGADYVNENIIRSQGYLGRSWGCPAVLPELSKKIIDRIKNGSCFFIFSDDKNYISHSRFVKAKTAQDLVYM